MTAKGALEVILFADQKLIGSLVFTSTQITVGRDPGAMVKLDDPAVSLEHALIHFSGKKCIIADLGSRNGTKVNGEVVDSHVLTPTDEVQIGPYRLRFVIHVVEEAQRRPGAGPPMATQIYATPGQPTPAPVRSTDVPTDRGLPVAPPVPPITLPPPPVPPTGPLAIGKVGEDEVTKVTPGQVDTMSARIDALFDEIESPQVTPTPAPVSVVPPSRQKAPRSLPPERRVSPTRPDSPRVMPFDDDEQSSSGVTNIVPNKLQQPRFLDPEGTPLPAAHPMHDLGPDPAAARTQQMEAPPEPRPARPSQREPPRREADWDRPAPEPVRAREPPREPARESDRGRDLRRAWEAPKPEEPRGGKRTRDPQPARTAQREVERAPVPMAPPPPRRWDDLEDDEPDEPPRFSLLEALRRRGATDRGDLVLEAVTLRNEDVQEIRHFSQGARLSWPGVVGTYGSASQLSLEISSGREIEVFRGGHPVPPGEVGVGRLQLSPGMAVAIVLDARQRLHLQFVRRFDRPPGPTFEIRPSRPALITAGASVGIHIVALIVVGILAARQSEAADIIEGRYAKIQMKDLELEPPPPPPPPPEEKEPPKEEPPPPEATAPIPQPKMPKMPKQQHYVSKKLAAAGPPSPTPPPPNPTASKLLNALGGAMSAKSTTSSAAATVAVTNLDAVSAAKGGGGFKVSGMIGKAGGDHLQLAAAGSGTGRIDTKGAAELTQGGRVGKVSGGGGLGKVRGLVARPPTREVAVQGELDRGEIQKVVNAHLREVQGCYERRLIKEPNLAGKIIFEWVISPSGAVSVVRIKFSDMHSTEVATCIQSSIREWMFPQPRGGSVTVTYPFVFSTMGL